MLLAEHGVEVKGASGVLSAITASHQQNGAVLAVVDAAVDEAEAACHYINESWRIPLVLMIAGTQTDWKKLNLLNASGYILEHSGDIELVARLNAMIRRFWPMVGKNHADGAHLATHDTADYKLGINKGKATPGVVEPAEEDAR